MRKLKDLKFAEKIAQRVDELGELANVHYAEGNMRAGDLFYAWRMIHKKTVGEVAKEIGVSVRTIKRLEAGLQFPDGHNVIKIINWLFSEEENGTSESLSQSEPESGDNATGQTASVENLSGGGY